MDANWFKSLQKAKGVTVHDIGEALGRDRTIVSRIYSGRQKMSLQDARVFADILNVSLTDVLDRAGLASKTDQSATPFGFSEGDVALWTGPKPNAALTSSKPSERPGVDIWRVATYAMALNGILPGDLLTVDGNAREDVQTGNIVLAQVYDVNQGTAETLLRRYDQRVLISASQHPEHQRVYIVDDNAVSIMGIVKDCHRIYA